MDARCRPKLSVPTKLQVLKSKHLSWIHVFFLSKACSAACVKRSERRWERELHRTRLPLAEQRHGRSGFLACQFSSTFSSDFFPPCELLQSLCIGLRVYLSHLRRGSRAARVSRFCWVRARCHINNRYLETTQRNAQTR